ncbi:hypothetical protein [Polymorphospora rubra]|uniref:Uncharacterized protein n=1 Tax=Polymorphospora rubra TaxID=338584 RepID=A0A810N6R8_9ACTN|nr:hypothetical protein [Polymorphospora rubra]BCJ68174.1 hypothetical protein Prubr_51950 [Polymorphospora rubra]
MTLKHRLLAAFFGAALVIVGAVAGVAATNPAPSGSDPTTVVALSDDPQDCGGCGNGAV